MQNLNARRESGCMVPLRCHNGWGALLYCYSFAHCFALAFSLFAQTLTAKVNHGTTSKLTAGDSVGLITLWNPREAFTLVANP